MSTPAADTDHRPCRAGCAACCIAPSISSTIPGMARVGGYGKPAGMPCIQLDAQLGCKLFGRAERPAVCGSLQPSAAMCGDDRGHALRWLAWLEQATG